MHCITGLVLLCKAPSKVVVTSCCCTAFASSFTIRGDGQHACSLALPPICAGQVQADIWALLDSWASEGGLITALLQYHTKPCWFDQGMHHSDQLAKVLYLEAEMRLVSGFALMTHRKCSASMRCKLQCSLNCNAVLSRGFGSTCAAAAAAYMNI